MAKAANEASASDDEEDGVHRLRDILVEEVSLVDRAANKRRFLIVKRRHAMANNGRRSNARKADTQPGAARRSGGKKPKQIPDDPTKARRRSTSGPADHDEPTEVEKAQGARSSSRSERTDDEDEETDDEVDDESEDTDKTDDDEDDDESEDTDKADDDQAADDDVTGSVRAGAKTSDRVQSARGKRREAAKADEEEEADDDEGDDELILTPAVRAALLRVLTQAVERLMAVANQVKDAEAPDDETEVNVPDELEDELEGIGELLEDVADRLPTTKATASSETVAKAGRRMAKERLARFQKALELLSQVLKELTDAGKQSEPGGDANKQKRAGEPGLGDVVASLAELTKLVKRQDTEIATLRKTRATSNAIPVDGGRRRTSQEVGWPLDMNDPISRDTVKKATSFYDD